MASLIQGFEYDIFISYRQKDNKHDGWVARFVENLKGELESVFKEDISIYFDENPHDRLQETHNVDKSLEGKLKCLIFIPILSQTYCDPKSYAWQLEFLAFLRMVENDRFGRDVKLRSGNVASRILPIRIHDIEQEDIRLFEKETGNVIRTLDFVFKTATGVIRPLKYNEDHTNDNLNKTFYSDQINKVALTIKEIILGLKTASTKSEEEKSPSKEITADIRREDEGKKLDTGSLVKPKSKRRLIILLSVLLCIVVAFAIYKITNGGNSSQKMENIEKSIAVLPFDNLSSDEDKTWLNDGMTDIIINQLSKISELRVLGRTSTLKFKNGQKSISEIGKELKVNYLIEGTIQRQKNSMRVSVQLIRVQNETHIWSDIYDRDWNDIFEVQSDIAQRIAVELQAVLTPKEKEAIWKSQTKNPEAYNLYLQGRLFWYMRTEAGLQKSVEYFKKAIAIDPDYALAYAGLADAYFIQAYWRWIPWAEGVNTAKELALKSLSIDKNLTEGHTVLGALLNYKEWKWEEARKEFQTAIELNPNYITAHHYYSELLNILGQNNESRYHINLALKLDPFVPVLHALSSRWYYNEGKLKESLDVCRVLEELDPDYYFGANYWLEFYIYVRQKEDLKAMEALRKALYKDSLKTNPIGDIYNKSGINGLFNWLIEKELKKPNPSSKDLANWFAILGKKKESLDWLEKAFKNPVPGFAAINNNPDFDILRTEPRFQMIIKKMGLSEYHKPK